MNLNSNIFKLNLQLTRVQKGVILISEPFLQDMYFHRSVVFLTEYDSQGSVGFIINKSLPMKITEVVKNFPETGISIGLGGPVKTNTVHFIHTLGDLIPDSIHIFENVYWGGNFDVLTSLAEKGISNTANTRLFVGYSGWSANQLDEEIKNEYWIVTKIDPTRLFGNTLSIWEESLENLGDKYKVWLNAPKSPSLN